MFSFVPVVLLVAIIARTQALECYYRFASDYRPLIRKECPHDVKYCFTLTANYLPSKHDCGDISLCKKEGCRAIGYRTICCCASDLCNKG